MALAMGIFTALCLLLGIFPELLYQYLPYETDYVAYYPGKVLFYLQLLLFSGLAFFLLLPQMKRTLTISLDFDWLWRVFFFRLGGDLVRGLAAAGREFELLLTQVFEALRNLAQRHLGYITSERKHGVFSRTWPIGITALWIAVLLSVYMLVYFF